MHLNNFNPKIQFGEIDDSLIARIRKYLGDQKGRKSKQEASTIKSYFNKFKVIKVDKGFVMLSTILFHVSMVSFNNSVCKNLAL